METQPGFTAPQTEASSKGAIRIQRTTGESFVLQSEKGSRSPLEIEGLNLDISTDEIVAIIREGRERV